MFKFNFNNSDDNLNKSDDLKTEKVDESLKESTEIKIAANQYQEIAEKVKNCHLKVFLSRDLEIGYVDVSSLTEESDSDLIPKVYEGGFKIWECTQDLADLLTFDDKEFAGKRVCDLGCSAGILGMIGLISGADKVDFQDYVSGN
jgi:2-polyprenyl-3-methyl-5-hydroxy-6-metoxy-1,4-benzoquinol methylase